MKNILCCLLLLAILFVAGCNANGNELKNNFPAGSIINTARRTPITEEQIQRINELLTPLITSVPESGYYNDIQAIVPNDDLITFNVTHLPKDGEQFDYRGNYRLNVYDSEEGDYAFVYSLCHIDNNPFVEENKCLGYLYVDAIIDADVLTNAKTIDVIRNCDSGFTVLNRGKYDIDITLKRIGNPPKYEDAIHAAFVTNKGLYVISYEKDEFDSQMNRAPKGNAKILDVEEKDSAVLSEVCRLIRAD